MQNEELATELAGRFDAVAQLARVSHAHGITLAVFAGVLIASPSCASKPETLLSALITARAAPEVASARSIGLSTIRPRCLGSPGGIRVETGQCEVGVCSNYRKSKGLRQADIFLKYIGNEPENGPDSGAFSLGFIRRNSAAEAPPARITAKQLLRLRPTSHLSFP